MQHAPARELLHFIKNSPTCYHVTENIRQKLLANGYTELSERERSVAQLMALRKAGSISSAATARAPSPSACRR